MGMRSKRPIAVALLASIVAHLLALTVYTRWYAPDPSSPATSTEAAAIAIALRPAGTEGKDPQEPRPGKTDAAPADDAIPVTTEPAPPLPQPVATFPQKAVAAASLDLNPVPILREEYRIELATLAVHAPMDSAQQAALQSAVNHFAEELPAWTDPSEPLRWREGDREFRIEVVDREPATATGLERAVLEISTDVAGLSLSARVPVKRMAFSHFAQVVDRWDPAVMMSGDRIVGRFHSNSELQIEAGRRSRPLVTGPTTVAGRLKIKGTGRRDQVFMSGIETRAGRLDLPRDPFPWQDFAGQGDSVHLIEQDARVVFDGEAGYRWWPLAAPDQVASRRPAAFPWLIVAPEGVLLQVQGAVAGSVLVYSPRRIQVTGSLTYSRDPREHADSDDFLGLISDGNVEVAPPEITGPGDIELFASVFAGRQFRIRQYRATNGGQLRIYGSVTSGSLSATEPRFTTLVEFDSRLEHQRPAFFPLTGRYMLDGPAPGWTVEMATAQR